MNLPTFVCGFLLVVVGALGYMNAELNEKGEKPMTALIPLWFGVTLVLCGAIVAVKPAARKHVMHTAALVGVLGFIGGFMPLYRQTMVKNLPMDLSAPPVMYGLLMSAICVVFVALCVRSFIASRKARQA